MLKLNDENGAALEPVCIYIRQEARKHFFESRFILILNNNNNSLLLMFE